MLLPGVEGSRGRGDPPGLGKFQELQKTETSYPARDKGSKHKKSSMRELEGT